MIAAIEHLAAVGLRGIIADPATRRAVKRRLRKRTR